MYELAKAGDVAEARRVQTQVTTLFDVATGGADFPEAVRLILELRGFKMGTGRCPLGPETHETARHAAWRIEGVAQPPRVSAGQVTRRPLRYPTQQAQGSCPLGLFLCIELSIHPAIYQVLARNALRTG